MVDYKSKGGKGKLENLIVSFNAYEQPAGNSINNKNVYLKSDLFRYSDLKRKAGEDITVSCIVSMPINEYLEIVTERMKFDETSKSDNLYFSFNIQANFKRLSNAIKKKGKMIFIDDIKTGILVDCKLSNLEVVYDVIKVF